MSALPQNIKDTRLWKTLAPNPDFSMCISEIRKVAEALGSKIAEVLPDFTDHSILHMDALWQVADHVLASSECASLSHAEAFLLGASFYVHDLGMAQAATAEGAVALRKSQVYIHSIERLNKEKGFTGNADSIALRIAAREEHAALAISIATKPLPGLNRYLIENSDLRSHYGTPIGQIAASHHWSIAEVNKTIGHCGHIPAPNGELMDLGYIACLLRIIDYAHINSDRARFLHRLLRSSMSSESLKHWQAQEKINGPSRVDNHLVYASCAPIADIDAWWTFYDMASGLDAEITEVADYLRDRKPSQDRFSLEGVRGVRTPQSFSQFVHTEGFEPLDIRFRPDSMERLVQLLGGKSLYGNDYYAPVRELLQNARDAVLLLMAENQEGKQESPLIEVSFEKDGDECTLCVKDNGVGMSQRTIAKYLLGIASNYWSSPDYSSEHPNATKASFRPVGKFGIGFLSVFMLGDNVQVDTQRLGGSNLSLQLYGIGRRGALVQRSATYTIGTKVTVRLSKEKANDFENIGQVVQGKAPMLSIPVIVRTHGLTSEVQPAWWKSVSQEELTDFLAHRSTLAYIPQSASKPDENSMGARIRLRAVERHKLSKISTQKRWPKIQPEIINDNYRIVATPELSNVLLCSKGFAIASVQVEGLTGMANIDELELNVARSTTLNWDREKYVSMWLNELKPQLKTAINALAIEDDLPSRFEFLCEVIGRYGADILLDSDLPWIGVIEPPGNYVLKNTAEMMELLSRTNQVAFVYGEKISPWNARKIAKSVGGADADRALIVPISSVGQPSVGSYKDEENVISGPLRVHFVESYDESAFRYQSAHLLMSCIQVLGRAWAQDVEVLVETTWIRSEQRLCGCFERSRG